MLTEVVGNTDRCLGNRTLFATGVLGCDAINALLEFADVRRVEVETMPVRWTEVSSQSGHLAHDPVEDAAVRREALGSLFRCSTGAEELLEHGPWVANHR